VPRHGSAVSHAEPARLEALGNSRAQLGFLGVRETSQAYRNTRRLPHNATRTVSGRARSSIMDDLNASQSDLANFIATVIRECRGDGMIMPFIVCAVSPNGSVVVNRVRSGDVNH
jgi:hypothetical protein